MKIKATTYTTIRRHMTHMCCMMCCIILSTLTACQEDDQFGNACEVKVRLFAKEHVEVTRAEGIYQPLSGTGLSDATAGLYVAMNDQQNLYSLTWNGTTLGTNIYLEKDIYTLYAYMPQREGTKLTNANATDNTNASLTFTNIPGIGSEDIMVSQAADITVGSTEQTVALKMDHLLARITLQFTINAEYNNLRTIKIRKVDFSLPETNPIKTYSSTITYGTDRPTVWNAPSSQSTEPNTTYNIYSGEQNNGRQILSTDPTTLGVCYVVPIQSIEGLQMRVTYDVLDKAGVVTRPNEVVTNKVIIKQNSTAVNKLTAGNNYKLNIQVIPTYLYVLSDNDQGSVLVIPNN